jgi:Tfp pilus assembly protein PilF
LVEPHETDQKHGDAAMPVLPHPTSGDDAKRAAARRIVELARAAFEDGRPEDTADLLERAVALDGSFSESYVLLAHLHMTEGSPELALAFLDRAEQLAARDRGSLAEVESSRGVVFEELGQWEAARDAYRRALRLAPENARARRGLARLGNH